MQPNFIFVLLTISYGFEKPFDITCAMLESMVVTMKADITVKKVDQISDGIHMPYGGYDQMTIIWPAALERLNTVAYYPDASNFVAVCDDKVKFNLTYHQLSKDITPVKEVTTFPILVPHFNVGCDGVRQLVGRIARITYAPDITSTYSPDINQIQIRIAWPLVSQTVPANSVLEGMCDIPVRDVHVYHKFQLSVDLSQRGIDIQEERLAAGAAELEKSQGIAHDDAAAAAAKKKAAETKKAEEDAAIVKAANDKILADKTAADQTINATVKANAEADAQKEKEIADAATAAETTAQHEEQKDGDIATAATSAETTAQQEEQKEKDIAASEAVNANTEQERVATESKCCAEAEACSSSATALYNFGAEAAATSSSSPASNSNTIMIIAIVILCAVIVIMCIVSFLRAYNYKVERPVQYVIGKMRQCCHPQTNEELEMQDLRLSKSELQFLF